MKRKLLATLLALCLIVGMIPVAASADNAGPWVVEFVSGSPMSYSTFDEAFSAVKSHEGYPELVYTILLTEDTKESITIKDNESAVLNIDGGVTLTNTEGQHTITVEHGGSLLVEGRGKVDNISHAKGAVYNNGYTELRGDVIFDRSQENGSDDATSGGNSWYTICNHGEMVISENVTVTTAGGGENLSTKGRYSSLIENGYQKYNSGNESSGYVEGTNYEYPSLTINGGNFSGGLNTIKNDDHGIVQINNGSFGNYYQCVVMNHHKATVTGGTFTAAEGSDKTTYGVYNCACAEDHDIGELKISGGTFTGADFAVADVSSVGGKITISNGTFIGSSGAIGISSGHTGVFSISGGTFSSNVSEYVADGYTMVESESGYTVEILSADNAVAQVEGDYFASLDSAFAAAEEGCTVQLLRNTTYNNRINVEKDVILDLGGYTLTSETSHSFVVCPSKSFTIQNGTIRNTIGTVVFVLKGSTITLDENATLECKDGVSGTNNTDEEGGATFNIYGDIQSTDIAVWIQGPKNTVNIDGADLSANYFAVYQNGSFGGNTYTIRNSTIFNGEEAGPAIYISNSKTNTENENQGWQTLTVEDSTITGPSGIEVKFTNATISNSTITATAEEPTFDQYNNGSTSGGFAVVATDNTMEPNAPAPEGTIEINGGYYSGLVGLGSIVDLEEYPDFKETTYEILNGHFTSDPSEYLADGLITVPSTVDGYNYTVADKTPASAEVSVAAPSVAEPEVDGTIEDQELASEVYDTLTGSNDGATAPSIDESALKAAANAVANDTNGTVTDQIVEDLKQATSNENITANDVTIVIQPYLDIQITDVDATSGSETITLDVTPMYRTVATTANLSEGFDDEIILSGEEDVVNAVQIGTAQPLTVNNTVTVTIPLPKNFAQGGDELFVRHVKSDNRVYFYTGSVEDNVLTFTNPNGFSEMTISKTNGAVAEVEGIGYANFQDAVDAVENGGTIEVLKSGDYSVSGNKTFSITYGAGIAVTLKAATGYVLTQEGNNTYTIAYAGGGTPSEPEEPTWPFEDVTEGEDWFYDAVAYVYENGIMAGTSATTFEPYMELNRAQAAQLFYNLEGKPAVTGDSTFTDVTSGHWAVEAITWAAENEVVAGIGEGLYDPDSNVTREQFAVMLYNYAKYKGYDLTATGDLTQFPDAGSISSWAETALSWANGKGLINGHENGTIDPKGSTIRAQAASIMANFDQNVAK